MSLDSIDLAGLGRFDKDRAASFTIETLNLPAAWEYIHQNRRLLLKIDQHGPVYAQADPPNDIMLFRRDPFQRFSSWLVWLCSPEFKSGPFTNFFRPAPGIADPSAQPEKITIDYSPASARYTLEHEGVRSVTEIFIPQGERAVCMKTAITNLRSRPLDLSIVPVLRPYVNPAMLAPWDKPEWYLRSGFCTDGPTAGFWTQLLNMNSEPEKRRVVAYWCACDGLAAAEISHEKFAGHGTFENPESIHQSRLRLSPTDARPWGVMDEHNTIFGYPPVYALQYAMKLAPGETRGLRQVLAMLPPAKDGALPDLAAARKPAAFLDDKTAAAALAVREDAARELIGARALDTPDPDLNRYVNEWLPLQLDWVCSLDRGWPSGMRGSRDSANDFTAMAWLDAPWTRALILTELTCQRSDGWFPRQYSAIGRKGRHDLRGHVDAGCWVVELIHEYLCATRDFDVLAAPAAWLDRDDEEPVLRHLISAVDYYISQDNIGGHGLCKIREGDWLDAVNRAGLKGRGESVSVTNQAIIALTQAIDILRLKHSAVTDMADATGLIHRYEEHKKAFRTALRAHAFNKEGFYSSVFNDDGHWLFSDRDPDGERRVYGPASWWSIYSGVAVPDQVDSLLKELKFLKCEAGWRLLWPPMGKKVIPNVGRIGSGDVPGGLWENATAYNQGSHGFLGRALAVAGKGDLLFESLQQLLPYDQKRHPTSAVLTPPYAVVNCWQEIPGFRHRGGLTFLTGSIAYGLRMAWSWMAGIKPEMDGLCIDPCIPAGWKRLGARFKYLGWDIELEISNPDGAQAGAKSMKVNGESVLRTTTDPFSGRRLFVAEDRMFGKGRNKVEVGM
jgi:hypothetical protein